MALSTTLPSLIVPIAAVLTAGITGTVSFVTLVISKENKISEFRQAWIDGLRSELSEFAAQARRLSFEQTFVNIKRLQMPPIEQLQAECEEGAKPDPFHDNRVSMANSYYALRLRLNPAEEDHGQLLKNLDAIYDVLNSGSGRSSQCIEGLDSLARVTQQVLKREWDRVKIGEPRFRGAISAAKWIAIGLGAAFLALLALVILS